MDKSYYTNLENNTNLNVRIPKELRDTFNTYCKNNMLNSSAVVRSLIIDFLIENEKNK
ncbi:hypothetical protein [uncultured Veillonella sp.]|uniref:hypothetical protein n=1 Tax=uncultured Veillonella sp. TaxID=159268 RepID=UPI0025CC126A|nr:hypothetical protein [uncultured Veillonella sp.]